MGLLASHGLSYALDRNWLIYPVSRSKAPLVTHEVEGRGGLHLATADEVTICRWDDEFPHANIALRTGRESGVVVIDCDGAEGKTNWRALFGRVLMPPETLVAETGGGGEHWYFRHPGLRVKTRPLRDYRKSRDIAPRVDVRGDLGSVVLPPSVHRSGRPYRWLNNKPMQTFPFGLLPFVTDMPRPDSRPRPRFDATQAPVNIARHIDAVSRAQKGSRNYELNRAAFIVARIATDSRDDPRRYEAQLINAGVAAGLDRREAISAVKSGLRAGTQ